MKSKTPKMPKVSSPLSRAAYKKGGAVKSKGGTTVNIVMPQGGGAPTPAPMPMPVPVRPPMPAPSGAPMGLAGGAMPAGGAPMPSPGMKPPGMKRGGHVMAGAGSGLGRLQKIGR